MSEAQITVRMDRSSWSQIKDDIGNYWGIDPDGTEVFESVRELPVEASEFEEIRAAREDQLRQLLSYCLECKEATSRTGNLMTHAYSDVAGKLAEILDGEG